MSVSEIIEHYEKIHFIKNLKTKVLFRYNFKKKKKTV